MRHPSPQKGDGKKALTDGSWPLAETQRDRRKSIIEMIRLSIMQRVLEPSASWHQY